MARFICTIVAVAIAVGIFFRRRSTGNHDGPDLMETALLAAFVIVAAGALLPDPANAWLQFWHSAVETLARAKSVHASMGL